MRQIDKISLSELKDMAKNMYGNLVKADVDVSTGAIVLDAELHADIEAFMLNNGSRQSDLWGINLHPDSYGTDDFIEFDSMINIRPSQNNRSRYVEDAVTRAKITELINSAVYE